MWGLKLVGGVVMLVSMVMDGWIYTPAFWLPWTVLCSCLNATFIAMHVLILRC
jgi:hypothetical protein